MSERATELAAQFERANQDLIAEVEQPTDRQWGTMVPGENWTVGVVAHHVADSIAPILAWLESLSRGETAVYSHEAVDRQNAEHAQAHSGCTQTETAELARREGATADAFVRGLTDNQLDTEGSFNGNPRSPDQMIRRVPIGHIESHLSSIRAALAPESTQ